MISIVKAKEDDFQLLEGIGKTSFIESHGNSASAEDIDMYVRKTYTHSVFKEELSNPDNIYHIVYYNQQAAGFSKIILNKGHQAIQTKEVTKLERLYLLKEFYSLKLGFELLKYNIAYSKENNQAGMWLFVWKENHRAVNFYKKTGFKVIGNYDFRLTANHSNPNYQMLLTY